MADKKSFHELHLVGKGHSGRGVRYVLLTVDQVDAIEETAAGEVGAGASNRKLWNRQYRLALAQMIVGVSEPALDGKLEGARWTALDPAKVDAAFAELFTPKDVKVLRRVCDEEYEVLGTDLAAILGKARVVLED